EVGAHQQVLAREHGPVQRAPGQGHGPRICVISTMNRIATTIRTPIVPSTVGSVYQGFCCCWACGWRGGGGAWRGTGGAARPGAAADASPVAARPPPSAAG